MMPNTKTIDRLFRAFSLASLVFISYLAGAVSAHYKLPPATLVREAATAFHALEEQKKELQPFKKEITLKPSPVLHKEGAYEGYTLYTMIGDTRAILVDMDGTQVFEWKRAENDVKGLVVEKRIRWRDAHAYPNGDLLVIQEVTGDTPYGYGLMKINKNSDIVWQYKSPVHHQLFIDEAGNIFTLSHEFTSAEKISGNKTARGRILEDFAVMLSPEGKELKKISIVDAIMKSEFSSLIAERKPNKKKRWDVTHTNSIQPLPSRLADAFPQFKAGQALISMHSLDAIAMMDMDKGLIIWSAKGPWKKQHDAEFTSDGHILLFDNQGGGKRSRILKYDPQTHTTKTVYGSGPHERFYTSTRGMLDQLPNGSLLINEANRGKIFEVNAKKEVVWKFASPYYRGSKRLIVGSAHRYSPEQVAFINPVTAKQQGK